MDASFVFFNYYRYIAIRLHHNDNSLKSLSIQSVIEQAVKIFMRMLVTIRYLCVSNIASNAINLPLNQLKQNVLSTFLQNKRVV